jgi:hypothetical protein
LKTGKIGSCRLSKLASWLWLPFKIGELALAGFKTGEMALAGFQKLSAQLREICYPIRVKDLNSPVLKSFLQIHKVFALNVKEFIIQYKIEGTVKKIMNICRTFSQPRPIKP